MAGQPLTTRTDDLKDAHRQWLRRIQGDLGLSLSAIAKGAGVSSSTLSRFMNDANHPHALSATTISRIIDAYGVDGPPMSAGALNVTGYRQAVWNVVHALHEAGALQSGDARMTADAVVDLADWLTDEDHSSAEENAAIISFQAERLKRNA
ncbi:helix-turn-helix domain-containing protein [Oricola cellulosilytica]|uniref:XRE family transcriptional regulator n=1 Tax=Oricola cellulosilytica TaxID=1429082 RepID=A0A4R0PFI0_9HYPH|nr:helix-turn-helix transcriptional regulator [Oricola cellulosilytica]TCD15165.1 XRE family transcriptional regulator [Oricola cellulosilytica]